MLNVQDFRRDRFNGLPTIEAADLEIRLDGKLDRILSGLGSLFVKHKVQESWGLCLLHKHYEVFANEFPIQMCTFDGSRKFLTKPMASEACKELHPSVYAIDPNSDLLLSPLEFTDDEIVGPANKKLFSNPGFIRDFRDYCTEHDLLECFGLIIVRSVRRNDMSFVEYNFAERLSVLCEEVYEGDTSKLIQTSWVFSISATGNDCVTKCMSACNVNADDGSHAPYHSPPYHDPNG